MKLPTLSVEPPILDDAEHFVFVVDASLSDDAKRVLNALAVASSLEAVSRVASVAMVTLPGIIASIAKARPRPELLTFDRQSRSFGFLKSGDGAIYAQIVHYVSEFGKWVREPDVMNALKASEAHLASMRDARRAA